MKCKGFAGVGLAVVGLLAGARLIPLAAAPQKHPTSPLTLHVLDSMRGAPGAGIKIVLDRQSGDDWSELARAVTGEHGRCDELWPAGRALTAGIYRLTFETKEYFAARGIKTLYPRIPILFEIAEPNQEQSPHYHIPLIVSPFGYSTYRGS